MSKSGIGPNQFTDEEQQQVDSIVGKSRGIELIRAERIRQEHKWRAEHDDEHKYAELAIRAAELALVGTDESVTDVRHEADSWGLLKKYSGEENRIRRLVVAGALIAAEIDRELRHIAELAESRALAKKLTNVP